MSFKNILNLVLLFFFIISFNKLAAQTKDTLAFKDVRKIYLQKDYETSTSQFLQLKERYLKESNYLMLALVYRHLGKTYMKNKEYSKAHQYLLKAKKTTNNPEQKYLIYQSLAKVNFEEKNIDSSLYYYQEILKNPLYKISKTKMVNTHRHIFAIYLEKKNTKTAKKYADSVLYYSKDTNNPNKLIATYDYLGSMHYIENQFLKANTYYTKGFKLLNDSTNIYRRRTILTNLMRTNYIIGNTDFARKIDVLREVTLDSIHTLEFNEKITEIEAIHNEDKARAEENVKTVKAEKENERTQYILAGTGLTSLVIILFGTILYRNSKLKAKNLSLSLVEQELNQQKELQVLQTQNQNKVLNATLDGREKERKDIAQTLHDSVSALLSSANMHLQVVKKKATNSIEELDKSQRIIDEASGKVRDLSHKLISAVLLKFGLEHAVYDMCEKYSNQDLEFELESEDKIPRFNQDFEIKIHNIIEECINNIMKHSKASEASVFLLLKNNTLHVTITDNGVGFDTSKISPTSGIGLSQIKARIENMEGVFDIDSKIDHGTSIAMQVPVEGIS